MVGPGDAERVTRDYEAQAHEQRLANSIVGELKQRMRAVLEHRRLASFGAWSAGRGPAIHTVDVRDALRIAPDLAQTMVPLTKKMQLALGEQVMETLAPTANHHTSAVIRWRAHNEVAGIAAQESRWWSDVDDGAD